MMRITRLGGALAAIGLAAGLTLAVPGRRWPRRGARRGMARSRLTEATPPRPHGCAQ
jgi:hypothetical protein